MQIAATWCNVVQFGATWCKLEQFGNLVQFGGDSLKIKQISCRILFRESLDHFLYSVVS